MNEQRSVFGSDPRAGATEQDTTPPETYRPKEWQWPS